MATLDITASACDADLLYFGTATGELLAFDAARRRPLWRRPAHAGAVRALTCHSQYPLLASVGRDRHIALWRVDAHGARQIARFTPPRTGGAGAASVALCFHPTLERLATSVAGAGVLELDFRGDGLNLMHCSRLHDGQGVSALCYSGDACGSLLSAAPGEVLSSCNGLRARRWALPGDCPRWFAPLGGQHWLIASDARRVLRLNGACADVVAGPVLACDDIEHIILAGAARAFAAAADGTVQEIDPATGTACGAGVRLPFAARRILAPRRDPAQLFVQCDDGGVYRVEPEQRRWRLIWRETVQATCCAAALPGGGLALGGEGACRLVPGPGQGRPARLDPCDAGGHTRRLLADRHDRLWLGQSSGMLLAAAAGGDIRQVRSFAAPLRDLDAAGDGTQLFACLDDGGLHAVTAEALALRASWHSPRGEPLWALACHPAVRLLAVAERSGTLYFLEQQSLGVVRSVPSPGRVRRMRWLDDDRLLLVCDDGLLCYRWSTHRMERRLATTGPAFVDVAWDHRHGYLLVLARDGDLQLCDLDDGHVLHRAAAAGEASCGLLMPGAGTPALELLSFGRGGVQRFRIHNEMLLPLAG